MNEYLEPEDALHIVERLGFHVCDAGLLASAVTRPSATVFGADAYRALEVKAAALLESLARHHPLTDGNKPMAWTTMIAFLRINGYQHSFSTDDAFDLVIGVASGQIALAESARLIARQIVPARD